MSAQLKPGLSEQYGIAVAPETLQDRSAAGVPSHGQLATLVGAMGDAARIIASGEDKGERRTAEQAERDELEAQIVPLLWRARFGDDQTAARLVRPYLATWVFPKPRWKAHVSALKGELDQVALLNAFCERLVIEWLGDRCRGCNGTGLQELIGAKGRRAVRTFGNGRVKVAACRACWGAGKAKPDQQGRARALQLKLGQLFKQGWPKLFGLGHVWIRSLVGRGHAPLRTSLGRRTIAR